ncbi:MAG: hypothetical protein WA970_05605, partial [Gammaproteobacteria bacterium]
MDESGRVGVDHSDKIRWHKVTDNTARPPGDRDRRALPSTAAHPVSREGALSANVIALRIQPDEGIRLAFGAKQPGTERKVVPISMDFCYRSAFANNPPSAYAVLLLDAMRGDPTLFTRRDGGEAQWRLVTPIEEAWAAQANGPLPTPI